MGKLILVVDDDHAIRILFATLLRKEGFEVRTANDGAQAMIEMRRRPAPDLVVLDLTMPLLDGRGFRREQLLDPALAAIPVLLVSGDADLARAAIELGAVGFIDKPAGLPGLVEAVRRHCR